MKRQPSVGEWVILVGGAVIFVFSFLDFFDDGGFSVNAWSDLTFPLASFVAIFGLIMALHVALTTFADVNFPDTVAGFTWPQIHLILGFINTLIMVGYLLLAEGPDTGVGFILMLLGAIATLVGGILLTRERTTTM